MVELLSTSESEPLSPVTDFLDRGEAVVIVDDSPEIVLLLNRYLQKQGLTIFQAGSAAELYSLLETSRIALVLLDICLPDKDGNEILKDIVPKYPDLGIIMVTGSTDLTLALDCLRKGADDYLTKPVRIQQFHHIIRSTLKKRRLAIDNRKFQHELESTNYRTQFLHALNLKMNTVYLSTVELKGILQAILVGITSDEGLKFNRAFLLLYNENNQSLEGRLAIGPASREDAGKVWASIRQHNLQLHDVISNVQANGSETDAAINLVAKQLNIPITDSNHVLVAAARQRKTIVVSGGYTDNYSVPHELLEILGHTSFAVVPLFSPNKSLGVIIVDNFVTNKKITQDDLLALEIFANQASLAIEHSHLYEDMRKKIGELELVTQELEISKDLLVASERYSAVGHMSAQLVHALRNPITSIGGTARLLAKKTDDEYISNFLHIITKEAAKVESTLEDLFSFVEEQELSINPHALYPLVRRSVMLFYATMKSCNIDYVLDLPGEGPTLMVDSTKIRQVFLHLVKNSIEAMPDGGILTVSCKEEDNDIRVSVTDTGGGITDTTIIQAKDPFFTTKTYGTGMGLTLVEKITTMHNASFSLVQQPGIGVCATVIFPKTMLAPVPGDSRSNQ